MRFVSALVFFVILLSASIPTNVASQILAISEDNAWSMIIDTQEHEHIREVIQEGDSGFAILGAYRIIQADPETNFSNVIEYPFTCWDFVKNHHETGGYAIAGEYDDQILWVDTYASGNPRRNRTYSFVGYENAVPSLIDRCDDQGYIICGGITNSATESRERIILRIDDEGTELWHNIIPRWYDGFAIDRAMIRCSNGGFLGVGKNYSSGLVQLIRIDDSGNKLWNSSCYKVNDFYGSLDIIEYTSGEYAFSASVYGFDPNIPSREYSLVALYYDNGTQKWVRAYEPQNYDSWSTSIIEMSSGGFAIGGTAIDYVSSTKEYNDLFTIFRIDAEGIYKWHRNIGEPYVAIHMESVYIIPYSLGGIALVGIIETTSGEPHQTDILLTWVPDEAPPTSNTTTVISTETTNTDLEGDWLDIRIVAIGLFTIAVIALIVAFARRQMRI